MFGFGAEKRGRIKTSREQEVLSRNEVRLFPENLLLPTQKKLSLLSRPTALRSNGTGREGGGKGVGSHYGSLWATAAAAVRSLPLSVGCQQAMHTRCAAAAKRMQPTSDPKVQSL